MSNGTEVSSYLARVSNRMNANRPLQSVFKHVHDCWIPVNPQLMAVVRTNLKNGTYEKSRAALLKDLKSDIALFTYAIRELKNLSETRNQEELTAFNPVELIRNASLEDLRQILQKDAEDISLHRLTEAGEHQAKRLQFNVTSAQVAEALSEKFQVDTDVAFTCAIFRQLGLTLIAWNYPHLYNRIRQTVKPGESVERSLSKILGFSPTLLGIVIARQWGLSAEIRLGMGDQSARSAASSTDLLAVGENLEKICKLGENLASVNEAGNYPEQSSCWEQTKKELRAFLGPDALKVIFDRIESACHVYMRVMPQLSVSRPDNSRPERRMMPAGELLQNNPYIKHCPVRVQDQLRAVYSRMTPGYVRKDVLDNIVKQIIPDAGFVRGYVYMLEPDSMSLVPRLAIGQTRIQSAREVKCFSAADDKNPVVVAYRCQTPVMESKISARGESTTFICGAIGNLQKAGVLYLEVHPSTMQDSKSNPLLLYRAIRQAVIDCLDLW